MIPKEQSTIKCPNCRQDILKSKMFLHEGFCNRNNIFCEHCERVYLKQDYNDHILEITENLSKKNMKTISEVLQKNIKNNKIGIEENEPKNENQKSSDKEKEIKWIEEYEIKNPIVISPFGQIVSEKNKNEFLLPILGLDNTEKNNYINEFYFNQEDIMKINNNALNYANMNYKTFYKKKMNKIYSSNNIKTQILKNQYKNSLSNNKNKKKKNLVIKEVKIDNNDLILKEKFINEYKNLLNRNLSRNDSELNETNLNKINLTEVNYNKIDNNNNLDNNNENNNRNSIIINNNIYAYNEDNSIHKLNNFIYDNIQMNSKYKTKTVFNPIRHANLNKIKRKKKNLTNEIDNNINNSELLSKEPLDNINKKNIKSLAKNIEIQIETNPIYNSKKNINKTEKGNINSKHIIKLKIDLSQFDNKENIEDSSIDDKNREILINHIKPNLPSINNEGRKYRMKIPQRVGKSEDKYNIRKKIFQTSIKHITKGKNNNYHSPKDNIRCSKKDKKEIKNLKPRNRNKYEKNMKFRPENERSRNKNYTKFKQASQDINNKSLDNIDPLFFYEQQRKKTFINRKNNNFH